MGDEGMQGKEQGDNVGKWEYKNSPGFIRLVTSTCLDLEGFECPFRCLTYLHEEFKSKGVLAFYGKELI